MTRISRWSAARPGFLHTAISSAMAVSAWHHEGYELYERRPQVDARTVVSISIVSMPNACVLASARSM